MDDGDQPAAAPVPLSLPAGAVVGIWTSFNGRTLSFAYCNASAFFAAVTADHSVHVPALGTGKDGLPCPTSRDFSLVDQDQSDTVATGYRVVDGRIAQDTTATRGGTPLTRGPDHRLLAEKIDPAPGCTPFLAPDLTTAAAPPDTRPRRTAGRRPPEPRRADTRQRPADPGEPPWPRRTRSGSSSATSTASRIPRGSGTSPATRRPPPRGRQASRPATIPRLPA